MIQRLVTELARLAVERRGAILVIFFAVTLGFASQLPKLEVDTSPEALVSEIEGQDEAEALFQESFGRSETQIIVALLSDDMLEKEALRYQYRVHQALDALPAVARVDGITHAHLPALFKEPKEPKDLPEQALLARAQEMKQAIEEARNKGEFLSKEEIGALVDADAQAFFDGSKSLESRLLTAESAPTLEGNDFTQAQYEEFVSAVRRAPWLSPLLISRDRTASALILHLNKDTVFDEATRMDALDQVRSAVSSVENPEHIEVRYGGSPVLGEAILDKLEKDRLTLNPAMGILCLIVLIVTFRWWPAVVAPLLAVGVASLGVMGGMALLGQPLTILTNIIPPLLLIVGLSDSVHLLGRYREETKISSQRSVAIKSATKAMIAACFLTSLTTAVGFGSMASAKTEELKRFGFAASFGVMLAYLATVFCVPAFISFFKPPVSWKAQVEQVRPPIVERYIASIALFVMRHFKLIFALTVVSTLSLSYLASKVEADAKLMDAFDQDEEISQTTRILEGKLAGIRPLEVLVENPDGALLTPRVTQELANAEHWLQEDPQVISVVSYLDPLRQLRAALTLNPDAAHEAFSSQDQIEALASLLGKAQENGSSYLNEARTVGRMTVFFEDSGVRHTLEVVRRLETQIQQKLGEQAGVKITFLGEAYTGSMGREHVLRDLLSGLALALVTIFALLTILFRSLPLGLAAMPPNIIPLLATGAYMMARGIQLNLTTVITFSIGIGLAVDDTVHVVARFREESARLSSKRVALLRAVRGTGSAIFVTAVSLSMGFGVLMLSEFVSVRQFGELIAVTVLNCLFGALVVQPALLSMVAVRRPKRVSSVQRHTPTAL